MGLFDWLFGNRPKEKERFAKEEKAYPLLAAAIAAGLFILLI